MERVVIVGGGFAGMAAAKRLAGHRSKVDVTLINRFENIQFRPLIPDIISRTVPARYMIHPIENEAQRYGFRFVRDEITEIEADKASVRGLGEAIPYDYLIVATGSETNFYGNEDIRGKALKLDDVFDGGKIHHALSNGGYDRYVVCGGGYTGVEIASHIRKFLQTRGRRGDVFIVEMLDTILGPLPEWMKNYTSNNLKDWGIDILLQTKVEGMEDREVTLSNGTILTNALLIWSAGLKAPEVVDRLSVDKESQGRISVGPTLRFRENAFAVGNTGCYKLEGACPRMATQMAVSQGDHAARNVVRSIRQRRLLEFKPVDFGYFVPMANWRSCGKFMGRNVRGSTATFLHYLISAYRAWGIGNKWGVMRHALKNR